MSEVKQAIENMFKVMDVYSEYGASDTEPRAVFAELLHAAFQGEDVEVPGTAKEWSLFSDMKGSDKVAQALQTYAKHVLHTANGDHRGFAQAMRYYY